MIRRFVRPLSTRAATGAALGPLVLAVALGACTSASRARALALEDADVVERELDILYACSEQAVESRGLTVDRSDAVARVLQTEWVADGHDRWRLTVLTRVHPRFGPGTDAVVSRDAWDGEGSGDLADPTAPGGVLGDGGWVRVPGTEEDGVVARGVTSAVRACWTRTSPLAQ